MKYAKSKMDKLMKEMDLAHTEPMYEELARIIKDCNYEISAEEAVLALAVRKGTRPQPIAEEDPRFDVFKGPTNSKEYVWEDPSEKKPKINKSGKPRKPRTLKKDMKSRVKKEKRAMRKSFFNTLSKEEKIEYRKLNQEQRSKFVKERVCNQTKEII